MGIPAFPAPWRAIAALDGLQSLRAAIVQPWAARTRKTGISQVGWGVTSARGNAPRTNNQSLTRRLSNLRGESHPRSEIAAELEVKFPVTRVAHAASKYNRAKESLYQQADVDVIRQLRLVKNIVVGFGNLVSRDRVNVISK